MDITGHFRGEYLALLIDQLEEQNIPYKESKYYSHFFETALQTPEARIPTEVTFKWLDSLAESYDWELPIHLWFEAPNLHPIPLIKQLSSSLEGAMKLLQQQMRVVGSLTVLDVRVSEPDLVSFEVYRDNGVKTEETSYVLGEWLAIAVLCRVAATFSDVLPLEIGLTSPFGLNDRIKEFFPDTRFSFGQRRTFVCFDNAKLGCVFSEDKLSTDVDVPWSVKVFIKEIALEHLSQKRLNRENLAHALNLSTRHFQRKLKQESNAKFRNFINELKIEIAKESMKNVGQSVMAVALMLGYSSASHFIRAFKKGTGITPREYQLKYGRKVKN